MYNLIAFSISSSSTAKPLMAWLSGIVLIFIINVLMYVLAEETQHSSDQHDPFNIEAILNNDDVRESYFNCFMDTTQCQTPEQKAMMEMFNEAYETNCQRCTEEEKKIAEVVIDWYTKNQPDKWKLVLEKTLENLKKKNSSQ